MDTMKNVEKAEEQFRIRDFYAGRSIFVTGATGFLGKVLIEKLLRCCPEIREIFLLMRPKKGMSIDDRLKNMLRLPLFDQLRKKDVSSFEKLIPVLGDVSQESLGLPDVERRFLIERVSVIFHIAANVRFHENIKKDILTNTRSTRDICILAGSMKNLAALVHVSTAYARCEIPIVEERLYPCEINWRKTIKVVESLDEQTLRIFSRKFMGEMPNTYTFSKKLAEQVISDYGKDLPCVILRPSIVVSTVEDPVKGWLDNFNGPVGLMIGGGKGILRVVYSNPSATCDFIPVDVAVKSMILTAWRRGIRTITSDKEVHVYNCCSRGVKSVSTEELVKMALGLTEDIPLEGIIWRPATVMTNSYLIYYVMLVLCHILPALVIDAILKFTGRQPMLFHIQRKIYASTQSLSYFITHQWVFENEKAIKLFTDVSDDEKDFVFVFDKFDVSRYFRDSLIGAKKYLLHEDMSRLEDARLHYNRMWWIDRILTALLGVVVVWSLRKTGVLLYFLQLIESVLSGSMFEE